MGEGDSDRNRQKQGEREREREAKRIGVWGIFVRETEKGETGR